MKKFYVAFKGLLSGLKHKAILIQFILGFLAVLGGLLIKLDNYEWLAFTVCIALVIAGEYFNTCIERLCDLYSREKNEQIGLIKDLSSGAVLILSFGALAVCLICLIARI